MAHFNIRRLGFALYGESYEISFPGIFFLSFIVGIIGGIYGIGGGAIIAPFFVTFFRLPVYIVAGAALMGTFITSVAGSFFIRLLPLFILTCPRHLTGCWEFCSVQAAWQACIWVPSARNLSRPIPSNVC